MVDFTAGQSAAVEWRNQDACVMAGPGSGKTTVLVERYRSLVRNHGFDPREILAITFTEKAAANMKAKIAAEFRHDPEMLREIEAAPWISTIHGFCAHLLRENAIAAGIDPQFCILDARESDDMQFDCINAALDEITETRRPETLALIQALKNPNISGELKNVYDALRSAGRSIAEVRAMRDCAHDATAAEMSQELRGLLANWPGRVTDVQRLHRSELLAWASTLSGEPPINLRRVPSDRKPELEAFRERCSAWSTDRETAPFRAMIFDVMARFEDLYRERKASLGALDFNDLERRAIELLRAGCRKRFRQVMLDEFQDINDQQMQLIDLIRSEDAFFAVGDANQSIYGFRHARPEIFKGYRAEIEAAGKHSADLLDNFRSRPEILQCVESLLNSAQGIEPRQLAAAAAFDEKREPAVEVLRIQSADRDEAAGREARWIAHRILAGGFRFRDVAVLCRNGDSMRPILDAFNQAGIPYVCGRRQSFLLSREGLDITALLHTIANPRDGISLATVLRSPLVGVSDDDLLRYNLTGGLNATLERFFENLKRWRTEQPVVSLDLLISRALSDCGMPLNDNIESFLQLARTRASDRSLAQFLEEIERMQQAINTESDLSDEDQGNRVQIMTAHAAKGLEFPVTIIAALDKGTRRSSAGITFTPEHGLGVRWKKCGDSWHTANKSVLKEREKEEANRLLYVAMTRAKEHLILSYSCGEKKPESEWVKLVEGLLQPTLSTDSEPPLVPHYRDPEADRDVETVPRPVIDGQHDSSVNVTALAAFAECPRKYYLERYLDWKDRSGNSADLGSKVHEILAGKTGEYAPEAQQLAEVFFKSDLGKLAAASSRAEREWEFIMEVDGTLVRGTIDLWFEREGEVHIVDYKTDSKIAPAKYRTQIALYAMALERALGRRPARASLHFLRHDRVEPVPVDDAAILEVRSLMARLREAQNALRFDPNEGEHCRSCRFNEGLCPVAY